MVSKLILRHLLAPNLTDRYIPTGNRVKTRLSGQVGTVVNVDIPAAIWDRWYVSNGGRHVGLPRSVCYHCRKWIYHRSLALAAASMNVSCVLAIWFQATYSKFDRELAPGKRQLRRSTYRFTCAGWWSSVEWDLQRQR